MSILRLQPSPHLDLVPEVYDIATALDAPTTLILNPKSYAPRNVDPIEFNNRETGRGLIQAAERPYNYINLESYNVWDDVFEDHPHIWDFVLVPGDYTLWGICRLTLSDSPDPQATNSLGKPRRRTLQILPTTSTLVGNTETTSRRLETDQCASYIDLTHPVQRPFYQAKIANVILPNVNARPDSKREVVNNWILHGLTCSGVRPSEQRTKRSDNGWRLGSANNIVVDMCLLEERGTGGIVIFGNNNTVQRCVIRNLYKDQGDSYGINVQPYVFKVDSLGIEEPIPVAGNKILDNEIYNMTDCIACNSVAPADMSVTDDVLSFGKTNVGGTIVDGNDLYNELEYHDVSDNLVDIKTGNDDEECLFTNNRLWSQGLGRQFQGRQQDNRRDVSSDDDIVNIHEYARNWSFEKNVIGEGIVAIREKTWPNAVTDPNTAADERFASRRIKIDNNAVYDCSWGLVVITNTKVRNNDFINLNCLFGRNIKASTASTLPPWSEPEVVGNRLLNVHRIYYAISDRTSESAVYDPPYQPEKTPASHLAGLYMKENDGRPQNLSWLKLEITLSFLEMAC